MGTIAVKGCSVARCTVPLQGAGEGACPRRTPAGFATRRNQRPGAMIFKQRLFGEFGYKIVCTA